MYLFHCNLPSNVRGASGNECTLNVHQNRESHGTAGGGSSSLLVHKFPDKFHSNSTNHMPACNCSMHKPPTHAISGSEQIPQDDMEKPTTVQPNPPNVSNKKVDSSTFADDEPSTSKELPKLPTQNNQNSTNVNKSNESRKVNLTLRANVKESPKPYSTTSFGKCPFTETQSNKCLNCLSSAFSSSSMSAVASSSSSSSSSCPPPYINNSTLNNTDTKSMTRGDQGNRRTQDGTPLNNIQLAPSNCTNSLTCSNSSGEQNRRICSTSTGVDEKICENKIVNFGASTSKFSSTAVVQSTLSSSLTNNTAISTSKTSEIVRNKKPNCLTDCLDCSVGCDVKFPLDAVSCIFDCLTEACIISDPINGPDVGRLTFDVHVPSVVGGGAVAAVASVEDGSVNPPRYQHIEVPGSNDSNETYLTLAFEAATLALGRQRIMPQGLYSQHVVCKQQDQLINRLRHIELNPLLVEVIKYRTIRMLDDGPTSGFGILIHPESVPMHTLAKFLFSSLIPQYPGLAFQVGHRAMRLPVLEDVNEMIGGTENNIELEQYYQRDGFLLSRYPRWWTLGHLETQQCQLISTMLSAAKGDPLRLSAVLQSARRNIHSSSHLFKLAQDAFRIATPENGPRNHTLLGVAFELGLQVMRMTLTCLNWRRREMVKWLVTCATHLGLDALKSIMQNWMHLFTPTEATGPVATSIMSHTTILRLNLSFMVNITIFYYFFKYYVGYVLINFFSNRKICPVMLRPLRYNVLTKIHQVVL